MCYDISVLGLLVHLVHLMRQHRSCGSDIREGEFRFDYYVGL